MSDKQVAKISSRIDDATITKYLSDGKYRIELHNLVHRETEHIYSLIPEIDVDRTDEDILVTAGKTISKFELSSESLIKLMAYGCYFGTDEQDYLWAGVLNRFADIPPRSGLTYLLELQYYPLLLAMYAGGLSALSAGNSSALKTILSTKIKSSDYDRQVSITLKANATMLGGEANRVLEFENRKTPLSDHLFELYDKCLPASLKFGKSFEDLFDEWEILVAMVYSDSFAEQELERGWAPVGRFSWRSSRRTLNTLKVIENEINNNPEWIGFKAGLFGGKQVRASNALATVEKIAGQVGWF